ncbi:MAG: serine hydrolase, partial [Patescibacteria group bacterium]
TEFPFENSVSEEYKLKDKPAALENFVPPTIVVFRDSESILPKRNWLVPPLELKAEAVMAIKLDGNRIYYNKNMNKQRPIASITKLMTAIIVLENYNLNDVIKITKKDIGREGSSGNLRVEEIMTIRSLLTIMLIESSNNAAITLANQRPDFILLMNKKAQDLNLSNTNFTTPDGLDQTDNYSSAFDIAKIFSYLINNHKEALEILKIKNIVIYSSDGKIEHRLKNTNELLGRVSEVLAGKTGYTDNAGESLTLLISDLYSNNFNNDIITVVLGSPNRFDESEKLIQWLKEAYIW